MIAAVDAVHEGDHVAGAVGQPQPQHLAVELDGLRDVAGEHQHVREPARLHHAACGCGSAHPARRAAPRRFRTTISRSASFSRPRGSRSACRRDRGTRCRSIRSPGGGSMRGDAQALEPLAEARQVILERAEGDELQLLARPLRPPSPSGADGRGCGCRARRPASSHVEPERANRTSRAAARSGTAKLKRSSECTPSSPGRRREPVARVSNLRHGGPPASPSPAPQDHSVRRTAGKAPRHCRGRSPRAAPPRAAAPRRSAPPRRSRWRWRTASRCRTRSARAARRPRGSQRLGAGDSALSYQKCRSRAKISSRRELRQPRVDHRRHREPPGEIGHQRRRHARRMKRMRGKRSIAPLNTRLTTARVVSNRYSIMKPGHGRSSCGSTDAAPDG